MMYQPISTIVTATSLSMDKHLHIVSFNVPLPADYGGIIDVFYRLKSLGEAGVKIHLHCFTYGRSEASGLEQYCEEVRYYRRDTSLCKKFSRRPYIVSSRDSADLRQRLAADDYPILLEGLHCCSLLEYSNFRSRNIIVRAHNVESDYFRLLAKSEKSLWRAAFHRIEATRLQRYEPILAHASTVLAVSEADKKRFESMGCRNVVVLTSSHPFSQVNTLAGMGDYVFYHGNLAVAENYRAVVFLAENLFSDGRWPFVVAGNEPPQWLRRKLAAYPNVTLVPSPDDTTMQRLVSEAQVNLLYTVQPTGLKLKLLNSLFSGRHCLVNSAMVAGTDLAPLCCVADDIPSMRQALDRLMATPFDASQLEARKEALQPLIPSVTNKKIVDLL